MSKKQSPINMSISGDVIIHIAPSMVLHSLPHSLRKHPNIRYREEPDGAVVITHIQSPGSGFRAPENNEELIAHLNHLALEVLAIEDRKQTPGELLGLLPNEMTKPDGVVDDTAPELGQKLLPFLLPRKLRDAVGGDLAQDFRVYVAKFGRTYAVRWYWWELGWLCVSRLSPTAIVAAIAFWLRRKIGF